MAATGSTREDLALRTQPESLGSPQHTLYVDPSHTPMKGLPWAWGMTLPSFRSSAPLDAPRSFQGASCLAPHCPEPCREGPTVSRLILAWGLEHCRVLLKVGKDRVSEGLGLSIRAGGPHLDVSMG